MIKKKLNILHNNSTASLASGSGSPRSAHEIMSLDYVLLWHDHIINHCLLIT